MNIPDVGGDLKAGSLCIQVKKKTSKAIVNLYTAYQGCYNNILRLWDIGNRIIIQYPESGPSQGQLTHPVKPQYEAVFSRKATRPVHTLTKAQILTDD